jgi:hypothetical protein
MLSSMKYHKVIDNEEVAVLLEKTSDADSEHLEGKCLKTAITTRNLYFLILAFSCTTFLIGGWMGRQFPGNLDDICIRHTSKWCKCSMSDVAYNDTDFEKRRSSKLLIIHIGGSNSMEPLYRKTFSDKMPVLKLMKHGKVWAFHVRMTCCSTALESFILP